ncbi:MAG: response regulator transcription factor [Chloroflexi bacterium]|nr:response regulator transcription factor [Chloroflexota bacterium]
MNPIRTLIADDHPALREGVAALLNAESEIEIVGTAKNGEEAVEKALKLDVQAVVMDIQMPMLDGIEAAHQIKAKQPEIGIVILSNYSEGIYLRELLSDGQFGYAYLLKTASIDIIKTSILTVYKGGLFIDPEVVNRANALAKLTHLTPRENDVLEVIAQGLDNQSLAKKLTMQPSTVSMHISNIYSKLEVDKASGINPRVAVTLIYYGLLN